MGIFDFLKVNEFKDEISSLTDKNEKIENKLKELQTLNSDINKMSALELKSHILDLETEKTSLNERITIEKQQLIELKQKVKTLNSQIFDLDSDLSVQDFGLYRPKYDFATSLRYKDELAKIRTHQKQMIRNKTAVDFYSEWTVNGSKSEGKKMTNGNIKVILRCFNSECEAAINKVKYNTVDTVVKKIESSFITLNKAFSTSKVSISSDFLHLKLEELYLGYEFEKKKEEEKEILREQREKEREEKALQRDIENKKKRIAKEVSHLQNIIEDLEMKLITATDEEKQAIHQQLDELKLNLTEFEDEQKELDYRLENSGAGYVYIISNIGAFGQDVVKIGVTRRLEPLDRINELSSASVPFKFDVHALIFSYDAFKLESELHERFKDARINMVNNRKEFFRVPIENIEDALKKYGELTIEFNKIPMAEEYNETIKLAKKLKPEATLS